MQHWGIFFFGLREDAPGPYTILKATIVQQNFYTIKLGKKINKIFEGITEKLSQAMKFTDSHVGGKQIQYVSQHNKKSKEKSYELEETVAPDFHI